MADILKAAVAHLWDTLKAKVSRTVTYRRGMDSVSLTVVMVGSNEPTVNAVTIEHTLSDFGVPSAEEYPRDYLVDPADLVLSTVTVLPAGGDYIDDTNDVTGETHRYAVLPPSGKPEYQKDGYITWLVVHTKHQGVV